MIIDKEIIDCEVNKRKKISKVIETNIYTKEIITD